jgi:uncharacterized protein YbcI
MRREPPAMELPRAISAAITRATRGVFGRGPARTRTYLVGELAFCVLEGALTPIEEVFRSSGDERLVRRGRAALAGLTARRIRDEVEGATDLTVTAHASEVVFELGVTVDVIALSGVAAHIGSPERSSGAAGAAIANALAQVVHEHWGRGPTRARAFVEDDLVFCMLDQPLTDVERAMRDAGDLELVCELRREFRAVARQRLEAPVVDATRRPVRASACQVIADPELFLLVFFLERQI